LAIAWYWTRFIDSFAFVVVGWCVLVKTMLVSMLVLTGDDVFVEMQGGLPVNPQIGLIFTVIR
jgi:hypothetical protein